MTIPKQRFTPTMILFAIILMDILSGMELDLFVPSFPELQTQFHLSPFSVEALLSVNFAGYCLSLFFVGSLADRYGRKPIILGGLVVFIIGSLLCLGVPFYPFLLAGRFLQGAGVAAPAILSFLLIADSYPLKQQQTLMAILNGVINLSVGVAPVLGSYVTLYFHWQGNFWVLLFLSLATLVVTALCVPWHTKSASRETLTPLTYLSILQSKDLRLLLCHIISQIVPYWIFVGMTPLLYMEALGVSLKDFGYYQGSLAFIFGLGSFLSGFVINKYPTEKLLSLSAYVFIVGFLSLTMVTLMDHAHPLLITLAFVPFVIGEILPVAILFPLCLNLIPNAKGRMGAVISGGRLIFSAVGLQIVGFFYQGTFRPIGIMLLGFIFIAILTLFAVIKNRDLMTFSSKGG